MNADLNLFYFLNNLSGQNKAADFFIVFFADYLPFLLIFAFAVWVSYSPFLKKEKTAAFSLSILAGLIAETLITGSIRLFYHRLRPFLAYPINHLLTVHSYSFPSGHSSFFFAFSFVAYHYNKKIGSIFIILTTLMTLARVAAGVHYPSDILAGCIVGLLSGYATITFIKPLLIKKLG